MIKKMISLFFLFFLSSCYTIHFKKTMESETNNYQISKWHHIGLAGLMEFSPPVNLKAICSENSGDWDSVRVQTGLLQGLVRLISIPAGMSYPISSNPPIEYPTLISVGAFYSPEEVSVSCRNK